MQDLAPRPQAGVQRNLGYNFVVVRICCTAGDVMDAQAGVFVYEGCALPAFC